MAKKQSDSSKPKAIDKHVLSPEDRYAVIPTVELMNGAVLTSAHLINTDKSNIVVSNKDISFNQVVVAAGPGSQLKVGDWVCINVDSFPKVEIPTKHDQGKQFKIIPPLEKIGGTEYLFIGDRHVKWIIARAKDANFKEVEAKPTSKVLILK